MSRSLVRVLSSVSAIVVPVTFAALNVGCAAKTADSTDSTDQAIVSDGSEAAASSTQASHIDYMLFSPLTSSDLATVESASDKQLEWFPAGCATRTKDATNPDVVHVTLNECTGPFGLVHWDGDLTITFSKSTSGGLHAEAASSDMTVNGHAVTFSRSADITVAGGTISISGTSAWTRLTAAGETISHTRTTSVSIDTGSSCRTINGNEVSMIGAREIDSTITGYKICQTATSESCPTGTWTQLHKASGKTVTIVFDGTATAKVEFPDVTIDLPLVCG
jgi:hypothetical protein